MPRTAPLSVAFRVSDLAALADSQAVALFLLSVAARPLPADFLDPEAETFSLFRKDLHRLALAAGLKIPNHRFYRALEDVLDDGNVSPATRFVVSGGRVRVVVTRPYATPHAEEAWRSVLSVQRLRGLGHVLKHDLGRVGLDVEQTLPASLLVPIVAATAARARRCHECDEVKPARLFGTQSGRLRPVCLPCR